MGKIFMLYMIWPLMLIMLFQPQLNNFEEQRKDYIIQALERANEKAAVEGYYTDEIKQELIELVKKVGYSEDDIELLVTSDIRYRGEFVEGSVKVPNQFYYIMIDSLLDRGNTQPKSHVHYTSRMSEYVGE